MLDLFDADLDAALVPDDQGIYKELIAGRYVVDGVLGRGGMGEVLLARDRRLGRRVALKRARGAWPRALVEPRLRCEAEILASLSHPAIVQLHDLLACPGGDVLVLEHIAGPSLAELTGAARLRAGAILRVAVQLATALAWLHERAIVHLDLKLENILLAPDGQPRLIDFGIAQRLDPAAATAAAPSDPGFVMGTPGVTPPEHLAGRAVDARADLFSLGVVLFELIAGRAPFAGPTPMQTIGRVLHHRPPLLVELDPDVPFAVAALVDDLLAKDPRCRPRSAHDVITRLHPVIDRW